MRFVTPATLEEARAELTSKHISQIELETAAKWAARAVAAWGFYVQTGDLEWRDLAVCLQNEAIEHAASGGHGMVDAMTRELKELIGGRS